MLVEHFHHAKHADARAVVAQRIPGHVRQERMARAGNDFINVKELDIWGDHQGNARAAVRTKHD